MLWLARFDGWSQVVEFHPDRGILGLRSQRRWEAVSPRDIDGQFYHTPDGLLALYKSGNALYFYAHGRVFELDDPTTVDVSGPRSQRSLRVMRRGAVVFQTAYAAEEPGMIPGDITPMVEEEHFDFGLWASNVSRSAERKAVCMEVWGAVREQENNA